MVQITLENIIPSGVPADGWIVRYRIKGSSGAYTTVGPFSADPIVFSTTDPAGTLYEGFIKCDCGSLESTEFAWTTPCTCTDPTYSVNAGGNGCQKTESQAPTITSSGYCLAPSTDGAYTNFESRIYQPGFTNSDIFLPSGSSGGNIYATMFSSPQWSNPGATTINGPLNREGVWIDNDCDGTKDPLTAGVSTTIATLYNNSSGSSKTIYIGAGADNQFKIIVNGVTIADTGTTSSNLQFKIWHIFPVIVPAGVSYINMVAIGDGSVNDSMGMVVYDNTAAQIQGATSDAQLNIVFKSSSLRGTTYDVATCPSGWNLDVSGGQGNYQCRRVLTKVCNSAS